MAYSAAGLGGAIGAGFLSGLESGTQKRETMRQQQERDNLATYTKLLRSGEWRPVDPQKGVQSGGVLRVGNVGMLEHVEPQPDKLSGLKVANLLSQIQNRGVRQRPYEGQTQQVKVAAEKDGKTVQMLQPQKWNGSEWVNQGQPIPSSGAAPPGRRTYVNPDNPQERVTVAKGQQPEGYVPFGNYSSIAGVARRTANTRAQELETLGREGMQSAQKLERFLVVPSDMEDKESPVTKAKELYRETMVKAAGALGEAQAIREGQSPAKAKERAQKRSEEARRRIDGLLTQSKQEEEQGPLDHFWELAKQQVSQAYSAASDKVKELMTRLRYEQLKEEQRTKEKQVVRKKIQRPDKRPELLQKPPRSPRTTGK